MNKKIVLLGAGGHAREVLDVIEACRQAGDDVEVLGYIVDKKYGLPGTIINEKQILGDFDWYANRASELYAICAVGNPVLRFRFAKRVKSLKGKFISFIHPKATITKWTTIGQGVIIAAGCVLTNHILLGNHVHLNPGCTIGHDTIIGDYVTLTQGVNIAGKVKISDGCFIGTGSNIIDRIHVGEWSIIGAGSTVIHNIPANTTVVGVPGRVIKTRTSGWHKKEDIL